MSCMDVECRRSFEVNGKSFFAASRVYEEDVKSVPSQSDDSVLYNLNNPCVTDMLSAAQIQLLSSMKSGSHNDQGMEFSKVSWRYVCVFVRATLHDVPSVEPCLVQSVHTAHVLDT